MSWMTPESEADARPSILPVQRQAPKSRQSSAAAVRQRREGTCDATASTPPLVSLGAIGSSPSTNGTAERAALTGRSHTFASTASFTNRAAAVSAMSEKTMLTSAKSRASAAPAPLVEIRQTTIRQTELPARTADAPGEKSSLARSSLEVVETCKKSASCITIPSKPARASASGPSSAGGAVASASGPPASEGHRGQSDQGSQSDQRGRPFDQR
mmetsp:Transcript_21451/g.69188  ORF Transcript_21451/g.69188 Transcript_21451/m.69188 type:complete len:214 (-) Transcript_21451:55-696(-)